MDYCLLCLRYDCPDPEGHAQALRLDMDTWPPDDPGDPAEEDNDR